MNDRQNNLLRQSSNPFSNNNTIYNFNQSLANNNFIPRRNSIFNKRTIKDFGNKLGLKNDCIVLNENSGQFDNFLYINIKGLNTNYSTALTNFNTIILTRNDKEISYKYPNCLLLKIDNPEISLQHCILRVYDNNLYIADIKSSNGTSKKLKNGERLYLYPNIRFEYLNKTFYVDNIYEERNDFSMDIRFYDNDFKFMFTVYSNEKFEISSNSPDQNLNYHIGQTLPNGLNTSNVVFPRINYDKNSQQFYLSTYENQYEEIYVELNKIISLDDENNKKENYIKVEFGDVYKLANRFKLELNFIPSYQIVGNQNSCYCSSFDPNNRLEPFFWCVNEKHPVCKICFDINNCYNCLTN